MVVSATRISLAFWLLIFYSYTQFFIRTYEVLFLLFLFLQTITSGGISHQSAWHSDYFLFLLLFYYYLHCFLFILINSLSSSSRLSPLVVSATRTSPGTLTASCAAPVRSPWPEPPSPPMRTGSTAWTATRAKWPRSAMAARTPSQVCYCMSCSPPPLLLWSILESIEIKPAV